MFIANWIGKNCNLGKNVVASCDDVDGLRLISYSHIVVFFFGKKIFSRMNEYVIYAFQVMRIAQNAYTQTIKHRNKVIPCYLNYTKQVKIIKLDTRDMRLNI